MLRTLGELYLKPKPHRGQGFLQVRPNVLRKARAWTSSLEAPTLVLTVSLVCGQAREAVGKEARYDRSRSKTLCCQH